MLLIAVSTALAGGGIGLTELPFAELSISTETPAPDGERIVVQGPFRLVGVAQGVRAYEAPIPVRPRALFFQSAPEGMTLRRGKLTFRYAADAEDAVRAGSWQFTADSVTVRIKADAPPPRPGELVLTYPAARAREDALWRATADVAAGAEGDAAFVARSAQVDDVTRAGLYLPAPSTAGWDVTIPADGVFRAQIAILPPEIADGTESDGADVVVRVNGEPVATARAAVRDFADLRVSLAQWAGQTVRLTLSSADANPRRDHVFVAAPALYTPSDTPKRVVLVFVDTLRRDHLGIYGHTRGASPKVDAWAQGAVIFDDARSVAPWTLPSTRSALSGKQPEAWSTAHTLPMRLADAGWATGAYVGNVYLSSNFDMADGWGEHGCVNWPYARFEVDRALDFIDRHPDQDSLVMVHFMDMHLPYKEPYEYRDLYEGERPRGLAEGFNRNSLLNAAKGQREPVKRFLMARYDQNLRYIDDQVARLLAAAGKDATVVLFADHGEEFFDHGDLEHGHTLYDELLRVPLVIKAPGLAARRVSGQVSLLDLTPTVLDLLGLADPTLDGHSLAAAARGEPDPALDGRALAFGRPLYGNEAWGSLKDGLKYISRSGKEFLFDLAADAGEQTNLRSDRDPTDARAAMAQGLDRTVAVAYRLTPRGKGSGAFTVELHVPGGIAHAWVGDDPTNKSSATIEVVDPETITASFRSGRSTSREVFVVPTEDPTTITPTLRVAREGVAAVPLTNQPFDGYGEALATIKAGSRALDVTWAAVPLPAGDTLDGTDAEMRAALIALGYAEEDEPEDTDDR